MIKLSEDDYMANLYNWILGIVESDSACMNGLKSLGASIIGIVSLPASLGS